MIFVSQGFLHKSDPNYGEPVNCYGCGAPHSARGISRIEDKAGTLDVPTCEQCLEDSARIMRRYWEAPDLVIEEGGTATTEQLLAISEKLATNTTEH